jgi:homeobox-leucine zipper protein
MEQEEVGLALGLSLGSGRHELKERPSPSSRSWARLEPSLSLSLPAKDDSLLSAPVRIRAVKRELRMEEDDEATGRALYSVASSSALAAADDDEGCNSRKKLRLTKEQSALLEDRFKEHSTLNPVRKITDIIYHWKVELSVFLAL